MTDTAGNETNANPAKLRGIDRVFTIGALLVIILSFFLPPHKLTFSICGFYNMFGLPCPGCGMTRSVVNISHGAFLKAFRSNPMGFPVYGLFLFLACYNFFPPDLKHRVDQFINTHQRRLWISGGLLLGGMLLTWAFRLLVVYRMHIPFLDHL